MVNLHFNMKTNMAAIMNLHFNLHINVKTNMAAMVNMADGRSFKVS